MGEFYSTVRWVTPVSQQSIQNDYLIFDWLYVLTIHFFKIKFHENYTELLETLNLHREKI